MQVSILVHVTNWTIFCTWNEYATFIVFSWSSTQCISTHLLPKLTKNTQRQILSSDVELKFASEQCLLWEPTNMIGKLRIVANYTLTKTATMLTW